MTYRTPKRDCLVLTTSCAPAWSSRASDKTSQVDSCVEQQFSAFGAQPWFIPNTLGSSFIKKEAESIPFIKSIYIDLGNCALVGPYHKTDILQHNDGFKFVVTDDYNYGDGIISDEEFATLYNTHRGRNNSQSSHMR